MTIDAPVSEWQAPSVGRTVHYRPPEGERRCCAALVVEVFNATTVSLFVFDAPRPDELNAVAIAAMFGGPVSTPGIRFVSHAMFDGMSHAPTGTWHWPERVPQ